MAAKSALRPRGRRGQNRYSLDNKQNRRAAADPNRSPAQRVRFGKEEQRRERALTYKISRSKRYKACSDVAQREGFEPSWDCSQTDFESVSLSRLWKKTRDYDRNHGSLKTRIKSRVSAPFGIGNPEKPDGTRSSSISRFWGEKGSLSGEWGELGEKTASAMQITPTYAKKKQGGYQHERKT